MSGMQGILVGLADASQRALEASAQTAELLQDSLRQNRVQSLSKLVKTPESFKHDTHEAEVKHFSEWLWCFRRWLEANDVAFAAELDHVEKNLQERLSNDRLREPTKERSIALYSALSTLVQGKAQRLIRGVQTGNGFEAYRLLYSHFCPANKQRSVALLQSICTYPSFSERIPLEESVLAFETLVRDYEKASETPCPEEITTATLIRCAPQNVRQFLYLRMQDDSRTLSYTQTRDLILSYDKANVVWRGQVTNDGLTIVTDTRDDPMDVDRIQQQQGRKGKGKGDGKGRDQNSHKGKGKGKEKGKGKGKDQKGGGKGKQEMQHGKGKSGFNPNQQNKQKETRSCYVCGKPGHVSKDCWRNNFANKQTVRRLDETDEYTTQQSSSSNTNAPSTSTPSVRQVVMYDIFTPRNTHHDDLGFHVQTISCEFANNSVDVCSHGCEFFDMSIEDADSVWECAEFSDGDGETPYFQLDNLIMDRRLVSAGEEMPFQLDILNPDIRPGMFSDVSCKPDGLDKWYEHDTRMNVLVIQEGQQDKPEEVSGLQDDCNMGFQMSLDCNFATKSTDACVHKVSVVVDSGADISVAPLSYREHGHRCSKSQPMKVHDASGNEMIFRDIRELQLRVADRSGNVVDFVDRFLICDVKSPILAVGKLFQHGWSLSNDSHGLSLCSPDLLNQIPLGFNKNSLEFHADVRVLKVMPVEVKVNDFIALGSGWTEDMIPGWNVATCGNPVHSAFKADTFTNPAPCWESRFWPFRSSLASMDGNSWKVVEWNCRWADMENPSTKFTNVPRRLVTVMSEEPLTSKWLEMTAQDMQTYLNDASMEVAEQPIEQNRDEARGSDEQPMPEAPVPVAPVAVVGVPAHSKPDVVIVNGHEIHSTSSLRDMRAAARFWSIPSGGAKSKVWARLVERFLAMQSAAVDQAAHEVLESAKAEAKQIPKPKEPTVKQREVHELTHLPYAPWCQSCIMARAVDNKHVHEVPDEEDESSASVIQVDFLYANKSDNEGSELHEDMQNKFPMLIAADKHSHSILIVPVEQKGGPSSTRLIRELYNFSVQCGLSDIVLQSDNEPSILSIVKGVQILRTKNGQRTTVRHPEKGQPSSNGRAERAVRTAKEMAKTLRQAIFEKCGYCPEPGHPLFVWSFVHGIFLYNHYGVLTKQRVTPSSILGTRHMGPLVRFGEPVVALKPNAGKSERRWRKAVWLGKHPANGGHLVAGSWGVMTARTIRRLPDEQAWSSAGFLDGVRGMPWDWKQNAFCVQDSRKAQIVGPTGIPELADEAGIEPDDDAGVGGADGSNQPSASVGMFPAVSVSKADGATASNVEMKGDGPFSSVKRGSDFADSGSPRKKMMAPPPSAVVSDVGPMNVVEERKRLEMEFESLGPAPKAPRADAQIPATPGMSSEGMREHRISSGHGGGIKSIEIPSRTIYEEIPSRTIYKCIHKVQFGGDVDELQQEEYDIGWADDDEALDTAWLEYGEEPPEVSESELFQLDREAEKEEVQRLEEMKVFVRISQQEADELPKLTTRHVFDWRKRKQDDPNPGSWYRRARLVSREYKFLDPGRCDVYSATLPTPASKMLICWGLQEDACFWTLDVGDAFLCVPQPSPLAIQLPDGEWARLEKLVPGQRVAAAEWSSFINKKMTDGGMETFPLCPTVFKGENLRGGIHVDDILLAGQKSEGEELIRHLKEDCGLRIKVHGPCKAGDSFQFLKRNFTVHDHGVQIGSNSKYLAKLEALTKPYRLKPRRSPLPTGYYPIPIGVDENEKLGAEEQALYRQITGLLLYIMVDRFDIMFSLKQLCAKMSSANKHDFNALLHMCSYIQCQWNVDVMLNRTQVGTSLLDMSEACMSLHEGNADALILQTNRHVIETFSDADWAHCPHSRKSTSGAVICVNGNVVMAYSRSQKCIATSSAESEYYAAAGALQESVFVQRLWNFLCNLEEQPICKQVDLTDARYSLLVLRCDSSAARGIMAKPGTGRAKHIAIATLWCQQLLQEGKLKVHAVNTLVNPSDLMTKSLTVKRTKFLMGFLKCVHQDTLTRYGEDEFLEELAKADRKMNLQDALRILRVHNARVQMPEVKRILQVFMCMTMPVTSAGEEQQCSADKQSHDVPWHGMAVAVVGCIIFGICVCGMFFWIHKVAVESRRQAREVVRSSEVDVYIAISSLRDEVSYSLTRLDESVRVVDDRWNALLEDDGVSRRFTWIWHQLDLTRMFADDLAERVNRLEAARRSNEPEQEEDPQSSDGGVHLNFRDHGYLSESGGFPESEMPESPVSDVCVD